MNDTSTLSPDQERALSVFQSGHNVFVTGPGGTGKTRLIREFVRLAKEADRTHQVCAMTGCASLLLQCGARTLHSWSGIKLAKGTKEEVVAYVIKNKRVCKEWRRVKILIIDEVSMMSLKIFEIIEEIARIVRKSSAVFGGIQVAFMGDFYQLPPVGSPDDPDTERFCFESPLWQRVFPMNRHVQLTTMFRQLDPKYREILLQIRQGELSEENKAILHQHIKREYDAEANGGIVPTKLFPIRAKADFVNTQTFAKIKEKEYTYMYQRKLDCLTFIESGKPISVEALRKCETATAQEREYEIQSLLTNSPCSQTLSLKKGAVVMCMVNLDMDQGICNGSQGVVIDMKTVTADGKSVTLPLVKFTNGLVKLIHPHWWQSEEYPTLAIGQIPLCLAWALTIHKSQGATLAMAEVDVGGSVFEYGQTYVALSRLQTLDGLYLSALHANKIRANPVVRQFYRSIETAVPLVLTIDNVVEPSIVASTGEAENDNIFAKFVNPTTNTSSSSSVKVIKMV
jgi:ATP-dependent DNA helicase PIF1